MSGLKSFKFTNESTADEHVMVINGAIGESGWFYDATSANDVRKALEGVTASTIRIKLNSGGGDVFEGIEIYNYLKDLSAKVIVEVTSLSASAATLICSGADEVIMRTGSTYMAHEASTMAYGSKTDMQKTMNALEAIDESIVAIYQQKTGLDAQEIRDIMTAETWFTAEEALAKGFVDGIESVEEPVNNASKTNIKVEIEMSDEVKKAFEDMQNKIDEIEKQNKSKESEEPMKNGLSRFFF